MRRIQSLKQLLKGIDKEIEVLKRFRQTSRLRQFRKRLIDERTTVIKQIDKEELSQQGKRVKVADPSILKSNKLKKYHNYIRRIRDNYPDFTYPEIRQMFRTRREGKEVSIPDVVWQNPSP